MTNEAYIPKRIKIKKAVYLEVVSHPILAGANKEERAFVFAVLNGQTLNIHRNEDGYTAIPSTIIRKTFKNKIDVVALEARGIIDIKPLNDSGKTYSRYDHKCREYRLADELHKVYLEAKKAHLQIDKEYLNAMSGLTYKEDTRKNILNSGGHAASELLLSSLTHIKEKFNPKSLTKYITEFMATAQASNDVKLKRKFNHDYHIYLEKMDNCELVDDTLAISNTRHVMQAFGRLTEVGGGFQSCSREMKHAAFSGIPDVYNYDLKSSQLLGLKQQFEEAGISTEQVDVLLNENTAIEAAKIGLTKKEYKAAILMFVMGAWLTAFTKAKSSETSIYEAVERGALTADIDSIYNKLHEKLQPLEKALDEWHNILVAKAPKKMNKSKNITNKVDAKFNLQEYVKAEGKILHKSELKRKLAAFYLQGQESCFIMHLTILSKKYNFTVLSNQHDGLVTQGEIPAEAVIEASQLSGLKYAQLEKKNFVEGKEFHKPETKPEIKPAVTEPKPKINITKPEVKPARQSGLATVVTAIKAVKVRKSKQPKLNIILDPTITEWEHEILDLPALMLKYHGIGAGDSEYSYS
jgi:hypothetical protein